MTTVTPRHAGTLTLDGSTFTAGVDVGVEPKTSSVVFLVEAEDLLLVDASFGDAEVVAEHRPVSTPRRRDDQTVPASLDSM